MIVSKSGHQLDRLPQSSFLKKGVRSLQSTIDRFRLKFRLYGINVVSLAVMAPVVGLMVKLRKFTGLCGFYNPQGVGRSSIS